LPRAESAFLLGVLGLGGCMTIYPDPELPDVKVDWFADDCRPGVDQVELALVGVDDATFRATLERPCGELQTTFADVPRERFRLDATLRATSGTVISMFGQELDLRDGLDERASVFFGISNVRVWWSFDMGATCASLAADAVLLDFASAMLPDPISFGVPCDAPPLFTEVPDGTYTITAHAVSGTTTVAASPPTAELAISHDSFTDAGTLVLTPCGSACP
jgi:hypothetical protein